MPMAFASDDVFVVTSNPAIAFVQTSGFACTETCVFDTLTFAPSFSNRLTITALSAPVYGKFQPVGVFSTVNKNFGFDVTGSRDKSAARAVFANTVFTPNCIPSDHADTSYGASAGAFGERRNSGYVCFSRRSFAYRAKTWLNGIT